MERRKTWLILSVAVLVLGAILASGVFRFNLWCCGFPLLLAGLAGLALWMPQRMPQSLQARRFGVAALTRYWRAELDRLAGVSS